MLLHRPSLQSATPLVCKGPWGNVFPENNLTWKHLRMKGLHFVAIVAYFQHTIGLTGANLHLIHTINELRDGGKRKIVVMGDFNCTPHQWAVSGFASLLNVLPITAGQHGTCRIATGSSQLDYLLIDEQLAPLIGDVSLVSSVPWSPHTGFRFSLLRKPSLIFTSQFVKPKPLPPATDSNGRPCLWECSQSDFQRAFDLEYYDAFQSLLPR